MTQYKTPKDSSVFRQENHSETGTSVFRQEKHSETCIREIIKTENHFEILTKKIFFEGWQEYMCIYFDKRRDYEIYQTNSRKKSLKLFYQIKP